MFNQFLTELRASARLRLGVALIFGVLWVYAVLLLHDVRIALIGEYRNASAKLTRLQTIAREGDWGERVNAAMTLKAELESRLWRSATLGLARASFQDFLNQQMRLAGITRPSVSMSPGEDETRGEGKSPSATDDLWHVKAKLVFDFNQLSFNKFLVQLAHNPQNIVVESLHVTKEPFPRVEAVLLAHFQRPDSATAAEK